MSIVSTALVLARSALSSSRSLRTKVLVKSSSLWCVGNCSENDLELKLGVFSLTSGLASSYLHVGLA